ncbi:hypothetical protein K7X08_021213 [Anisodus acutangulus]|uniref:Uncharacterized protein n=1 Tax=Anisodus acutangulus TaxID=402998 RepID=A0A9Q1LYY9_9SOLA|nr:hypothetical protein K7X08_021213 [Anisodus acutangulus]
MADSASDSLNDFTSMDFRDGMYPKQEGVTLRYRHLFSTNCSRLGKASSETSHSEKDGFSSFKNLSLPNCLSFTFHVLELMGKSHQLSKLHISISEDLVCLPKSYQHFPDEFANHPFSECLLRNLVHSAK